MKEELKDQDLRSSYLPVLNKQLNTVCSAFFFFFFGAHYVWTLYSDSFLQILSSIDSSVIGISIQQLRSSYKWVNWQIQEMKNTINSFWILF